jgi:hypothetical protein
MKTCVDVVSSLVFVLSSNIVKLLDSILINSLKDTSFVIVLLLLLILSVSKIVLETASLIPSAAILLLTEYCVLLLVVSKDRLFIFALTVEKELSDTTDKSSTLLFSIELLVLDSILFDIDKSTLFDNSFETLNMLSCFVSFGVKTDLEDSIVLLDLALTFV